MSGPYRGLARLRYGALLLGALGAGLVACGSDADPVATPPGAAVLAGESRYQITLESTSPTGAGTVGRLRVRVEPRNGWHVAPEAPAWLRLDAAAGLEFDSTEQRGPETAATADELVFAREFKAENAMNAIARGEVKFGICEGEDESCSIVKRDLELPLKIVFEPARRSDAIPPE